MIDTNSLSEKKKGIIAQIDAVAHYLPGVIVIHEFPRCNLVYMSQRGLLSLGMTLEQLIAMGPEYDRRYFNEIDAVQSMQAVFAVREGADHDELASFFQQMRTAPMEPYKWHLSASKVLLQDERGMPVLVITIAQPVANAMDGIEQTLDRLHKDNMFLKANYTRFSSLTERELEVLILIGNSKSVREVSELLFISLHTVESHRKNFRKKLNIKTSYDLQEYIRAFGLLK